MSEYSFKKVTKEEYYSKKRFGFKVTPLKNSSNVDLWVGKGKKSISYGVLFNEKTTVYNRVIYEIWRCEGLDEAVYTY